MNSIQLSFVIVGRNDDYGGKFVDRTFVFLRSLINQLSRYPSFQSEIVFVEWNPLEGRKSVAEIFETLDFPKNIKVKIITITNQFHSQLENSDKIPVFEYLGKNIGIRRSSGTFILVTNPDILYSDQLIERIVNGSLKNNCYYRTSRYDFWADLTSVSPNNYLLLAKESILEVLAPFGRVRISPGLSYKNNLTLVNLRIALSSIIRSKIFYAKKTIFSLGSGDFFLAHRSVFEKIRGYNESRLHSHIDTLICQKAVQMGVKMEIFPYPSVIYHQEHTRDEHQERPNVQFSRLKEYHEATSNFVETWGFSDIQFLEYVLPQ